MEDSSQRSLSRKYESLDYDLVENVIQLEHLHASRFNRFWSQALQRWIVMLMIGFSTAVSGFIASFGVSSLTRIKFSQIVDITEHGCKPSNSTDTPLGSFDTLKCMYLPSILWLSWNVIPSLIGTLLVTYMAPVAAGSGIPVVKCYLNGVNIPGVLKFKTYLAKLVGVVSSVVGGLAVGKEGPFIHCGAAIGSGISQGKLFKWDLKIFKSFRNDRDKRDFVSAGAAAGVAAAFGSPIGGVLFALEEGASFWNQLLTLQVFFCSMMTSFILNLFMSAYKQNPGILSFHSLVNFGLVEELDYFWFEIPIYMCIAVLGGGLGAFFCYSNYVITKFRKKYINKRYLQVLETVSIAILTVICGVLLITVAPQCKKLPTNINATIPYKSNHILENFYPFNWSLNPTKLFTKTLDNTHNADYTYNPDEENKKALSGHIFTFMCPPGQFSTMSSLWLKTSEGSASSFMVLEDDIWPIQTLSLFLLFYYILSILTYGLSISSGVFIPSILTGATGGRIIGLILRYYLGPLDWLAQLNKFSIVGAVSVLGGVTRMTISLTVIIIETTGCISFGMPIMICLMVSKWVADLFIEGLYDIAIHMANVPFLDWEPLNESHSIYASDAMSPNVKVLRTTETVSTLVSILKSTSHNGFPVVDFNSEESYHETDELYGSHSRQAGDSDNFHMDRSFGSHSDTQQLVSSHDSNQASLVGSFQRCSIIPKRESYGRLRGLVLRWQILVMLHLKIFNENERSFENLNLPAFQKCYPNFPSLEQVISSLSLEMLQCHVDLRSIMNPTPYSVLHSASFPRIFKLFRSLGLRHLIVIDDRNQVVGMLTRKDLARYISRNEGRLIKFHELKYSS